MSNIEPVGNDDEVGVFAWIKPPRHVATPEASHFTFTMDFRVSYYAPGMVGDDVTPARPVGQAMPAQPVDLSVVRPLAGVPPDEDGAIETASIRRGGRWVLSIVPVAASDNGMPFEAEWGPLSWAQGWIDGRQACGGDSEEPGYGLEWRRHAARRLLISLISESGCKPPQHGDPSGDTVLGAECGVFAWLGWPKDAIKPPPEYGELLFAADFRAIFTEWHPGKLRGTVCPPEPVEMDIARSLVRLVSIEMAKGRWTLYAKGPATLPATLNYQVVSGPRSQARSWLSTPGGKAWRDSVGPIILITLTSHAVPL